MKVVIVEDEPNAVKQLMRLLLECDPAIQIDACLTNIKNTVEWLNTHERPDLMFFDIQLTDGLSFEIFEQCEVRSPVIFCTAFDQYAIRAFKVNSIDYLLKPLEKKALQKSLTKYNELQLARQDSSQDFLELFKQLNHAHETTKTRFIVKFCQDLLSIDVNKIAYFFIEHKIVNLVTFDNKSYLVEHSLDEIENMIDEYLFFRVSRQALVSINAIKNVESDFGRLTVVVSKSPKQSFSVSREKNTVFRNWFGR